MPVRSFTRSTARTSLPAANFSATLPEWQVSRMSTCFCAGASRSTSARSALDSVTCRRAAAGEGAVGVVRQHFHLVGAAHQPRVAAQVHLDVEFLLRGVGPLGTGVGGLLLAVDADDDAADAAAAVLQPHLELRLLRVVAA